MSNDQKLQRDELDLSELRRHVLANHPHARTESLPRKNADLSAWHAREHHRYTSSLGHIHRGPGVKILRGAHDLTIGQIARPLGWYTGREMVTREQMQAELRERLSS